MRVVVDTNVFIGACLARGAASQVIEACMTGRLVPVMGSALFLEYEDVLSRRELFAGARLDADERNLLLDVFLSKCRWHAIYFLWRPNLRDEGDNHLMELAVAANATHIVTNNLRDFRSSNLRFEHIGIISPQALIRDLRP